MRRLRRHLAAATAALALSAVAPAAFAHVIDVASIATSDGPRTYLVARPSSEAGSGRPLVILLHGHMGSARQMLGLEHSAAPNAEWLKIVDRENLVLAALDGAIGGDGQRGWNDCRSDAETNPRTDDVAFVHAVIDRLAHDRDIDRSRIYVMGMSNGAMMAYRLALELDPPIAAFAAVSGSMAAHSVCAAPSRPISVLLIHGTRDPIVPYSGGPVGSGRHSRGEVIGVEQAAAIWRKPDDLSDAAASTTAFPHREGNTDPTRATLTLWGTNPAAAQVGLLRVDGGGHVEPSLTRHYARFYGRIVGTQNHDLETAEEVWRFFRDKRSAPQHGSS